MQLDEEKAVIPCVKVSAFRVLAEGRKSAPAHRLIVGMLGPVFWRCWRSNEVLGHCVPQHVGWPTTVHGASHGNGKPYSMAASVSSATGLARVIWLLKRWGRLDARVQGRSASGCTGQGMSKRQRKSIAEAAVLGIRRERCPARSGELEGRPDPLQASLVLCTT